MRSGLLLAAGLLAASSALAGPDFERSQSELVQCFERGRESLDSRQWAQAELWLERCLMLDADHAQARLELAILLAQRGSLTVAKALIASLVDDPRTPPGHRERLQSLLAIAPAVDHKPASTEAVWSSEATVAWSRNPLARSDARDITLTLPDGYISVPIAQDVRPAGQLGLTVQRTAPGGLSLDASLQSITGSESLQAGRVSLAGPLAWPDPKTGGGVLGWYVQSRRSYDGAMRNGAGMTRAWDGWQMTVGWFAEPTLSRSGPYVWLERSGSIASGVQAQVFLEAEQSAHGVPGHVRFGLSSAWSPAPRWTGLLQASVQHEFGGYSALLENGAARSLQHLYLALERSWPVAAESELAIRLQVGRRWSNISMFDYRDAGMQAAWRTRWR